MKKILSFITIILLLLGFAGCNTGVATTLESTTTSLETSEDTTLEESTTEVTTSEETTEELNQFVEINLYSVNDFHGGAYYGGIDMMSNMGAYIKAQSGNTIALSNGDMLQGTAISNYYKGRVVIEGLNESGFDGFVIGNHEFDWGIDLIGDYRDGDQSNGELNHPVLAANIIYEDTQSPLDFTVPYIIKEFEGVKVGVIGMIGLVMDSIAPSKTENIEFLDPVLTAAKYASELREDKDVDIVVIYIHDGSGIGRGWGHNEDFAALSGSEKIDAVFNGHSHSNEASEISRLGVDMPYAQVNNKDTFLAHIKLNYDRELKSVISFTVNGLSENSLSQTDSNINAIIHTYENNTDYIELMTKVLTISNGYYGRDDLKEWGASVIRDYAGLDIGATNSGGFRVTMEPGQVTMEDFYTIYPFDNVIKSSKMTGQQIQDFYFEVKKYREDVVFDDGLSSLGDRLYINGSPINLSTYYTVGAVDYIFDQTKYDFLEGTDIQQTDYYMRDLLIEDLRNARQGFDPNNGTNFFD